MEALHSENPRIGELIAFLGRMKTGPAEREEYDRYAEVLNSATALEVNAALDSVLAVAGDIAEWKTPVARFIRAVSQGVEKHSLPVYPEKHLLGELESENDRIEQAISELQRRAKAVQKGEDGLSAIIGGLSRLDTLSAHYIRLQNELFPLFERASPQHACVKLMWALEDDVLSHLKKLTHWQKKEIDSEFWSALGSFFLLAGSLLWRERHILFPAAHHAIPEAFLQTDRRTADQQPGGPQAGQGLFSTTTGTLSSEQLDLIFRLLPVDISFIAADDRVAFYSDPPHRIFPRSPAVIGRKVQNCHPPKSVAMVEEILSSFKDGSRDSAEFWLTVAGKFVHIEYRAVRDERGTYLGTLEISQDATHLRSLEGQKRLL